INDWGGVSPVTPDFVNPEAPWPELVALAQQTESAGKQLIERLCIYPRYLQEKEIWVDPAMRTALAHQSDASGWAREDAWAAGAQRPGSATCAPRLPAATRLLTLLQRAQSGATLAESELVELFSARGDAFLWVCRAADELRQRVCGESVGYVVNRNINYTNVCSYKCRFCAFSQGKLSDNLRGEPYHLPLSEIERRTVEAWARGATEVCL